MSLEHDAAVAYVKHLEDKVRDSQIRIMKVRVSESGPILYLPESRKDDLWAYCEDWIGKIEIRFTTMTQAEFDALPEFTGF